MNTWHMFSRVSKKSQNVNFLSKYCTVIERKASADTSDNAKEETRPVDIRPQFGNRFLTDSRNVFEHNAWDNVVWDEAQEREAKTKTNKQMEHMASKEDQKRFEEEAGKAWDDFYGLHKTKFFKDKKWLFNKFPELSQEFYLNRTEYKPCDKVTASQHLDQTVGSRNLTSLDGTESTHSTKGVITPKCSVTEYALDNLEARSAFPNTSNVNNVNNVNEQKSGNVNTDCTVTNTGTFPGQSSDFRIFEVGCGVGNTVFPILKANNDPNLMVYCCDFSPTAVDLLKENKDYSSKRCHAFVCDISDPDSLVPVPNNSLDIIILIFVLSAINPDKCQAVLNRLAGLLKPGGMILFRDYGRYDSAQLRFKQGQCLSENLYARGDGTTVYYFTQDELRTMMTSAGLVEKQNLVDRRLQIDRGRQLKMYRVWIQCKYVKPDDTKLDENKRDNS